MKIYSKNFLITILIIFLITILITILIINYHYGKLYHYCPKCPSNNVYLIDVNVPNKNIIEKLQLSLKNYGTILNPEFNFNNSKGKKMNYIQLKNYCPEIITHYLTEDILKITSNTLGENVTFSDEKEKYRIFAKIYNEKNDFIDWHYDNNFTKGNRYTLVIPLIIDDCNTAEFEYKDRKTKEEILVKIPIGKGVLYNGSELYHRITKQTNGCERVVIIIPLYSNYSKSIFGEIREKIRNITNQQLSL